MDSLVVLGLGGNLCKPEDLILSALELLERELGEMDKVSSYFTSKAWGVVDQPDFVNLVAGLFTNESPEQILEKCLEIELQLGRDRTGARRWGERLIDIDVLYVGAAIINTNHLVVPHPQLAHRNFVLKPLCEIYPDLLHPSLKMTSLELLERCDDKGEVEKM